MVRDMMHLVMHTMTRQDSLSRSDWKAITVRLPSKDYSLLKEYADARGTSLNSVVSEAIAQYEARIEREQAVARVETLQQRLRRSHEVGADSVTLLREMREGRT